MEVVAALAITLAIVSMIVAIGHAMELSRLRASVEELNRVAYALYRERHPREGDIDPDVIEKVLEDEDDWKGYFNGNEWMK
jgi:hypothetical protein